MTGLLADGWFYISSAGLLVSGVLFFFLLSQYRAASEAADAPDAGEAEMTIHEPVAPVMVLEEKAPEPPARVASVEKRAEPAVDPVGAAGGLGPSVVYLQNIKSELDEIHKEMRALAKRVDDELGGAATRDQALIERLTELTRSVEAIKKAAPAAPAPAAVEVPKPAPKAVPAPKTEPIVELPKPAPAPSPSPEETIRMELGGLITPSPAAPPAPADPPAAERAPEEKPRRGPVWPV